MICNRLGFHNHHLRQKYNKMLLQKNAFHPSFEKNKIQIIRLKNNINKTALPLKTHTLKEIVQKISSHNIINPNYTFSTFRVRTNTHTNLYTFYLFIYTPHLKSNIITKTIFFFLQISCTPSMFTRHTSNLMELLCQF